MELLPLYYFTNERIKSTDEPYQMKYARSMEEREIEPVTLTVEMENLDTLCDIRNDKNLREKLL